MDKVKQWIKELLTGRDNQTLAIGRVIGITVSFVFLLIVPIVAGVTVVKHVVPASEWNVLMDKLSIYVPSICLAAAGMIGLTAPSEPTQKKLIITDDSQN